MNYRPQGSSVHGIFQNIGVGCHSLLQGIFPSQGSNLHCRQILYRWSHQGSLSCSVSTASSLHHYCDVSPSIRLSMLHTGGPNQPFAQLMVEREKVTVAACILSPNVATQLLGWGGPESPLCSSVAVGFQIKHCLCLSFTTYKMGMLKCLGPFPLYLLFPSLCFMSFLFGSSLVRTPVCRRVTGTQQNV